MKGRGRDLKVSVVSIPLLTVSDSVGVMVAEERKGNVANRKETRMYRLVDSWIVIVHVPECGKKRCLFWAKYVVE